MKWILCFGLLFSPLIAQNESNDQLYLSLNIEDGKQLELSDGTTYEIAPEDRIYSAYWITPFPIMISNSGNADYPIKITNLNTGVFVKGKKVSLQQELEQEQKEFEQMPQQQPQSPPKQEKQQK